MSTTTPTKTETEKAARAARKAEREAIRLQKTTDLQTALCEAETHIKPPPELGHWGVVKTGCWVAIHDKLVRQTRLKRKSTARIRSLNEMMASINVWDADRCSQVLSQLKDGAA